MLETYEINLYTTKGNVRDVDTSYLSTGNYNYFLRRPD